MKLISSWDDGSAEDVRLAELMKKYDIPTIFFIPYFWRQVAIGKNRSYLSETEAQELAQDFVIGSHTINHLLLTRCDPEIAEYEIRESKNLLQKKFKQWIWAFCYPRGYANDTIREQVKNAGYTYARNILVGNTDEPDDNFWATPTVHVGVSRKEYGGKDWLEYAIEKLEFITDRGYGVYSIAGHGWEIEENNQWAELETLLKKMSEVRK